MRKLLTIMLAACLAAACSTDDETGNPKPTVCPEPDFEPVGPPISRITLSPAEKEMAAMTNDFAIDLLCAYSNLSESKSDIVLSPLSIQIALSMLANGADGSTYQSIADALRWGDKSRDDINAFCSHLISDLPRVASTDSKVRLANGLWHSPSFPIASDFQSTLQTDYLAAMRTASADKVVAEINQWCSNKTNGLIDHIINQVSPNYTLILANALYLKSGWACRFMKSDTKEGTFTNTDGTTRTMDFMLAKNLASTFASDDKFSMATFPLEDYRFMFSILLPTEGTSMDDAICALKDYGINKALDSRTGRMLNLTMPRFDARTESSIQPVIAAMGGEGIFSSDANYSLLSTQPTIISDAIHAARLAVDEDGVEGGAATVIVGATAMPGEDPSKPLEFRADRTFLFIISEQSTSTILFIGRVGY